MFVTTEPESKPDVVITMSWNEAQILRNMCGGASAENRERDFVSTLNGQLQGIGIKYNHGQRRFHGKFD